MVYPPKGDEALCWRCGRAAREEEESAPWGLIALAMLFIACLVLAFGCSGPPSPTVPPPPFDEEEPKPPPQPRPPCPRDGTTPVYCCDTEASCISWGCLSVAERSDPDWLWTCS